MDRYVYVKSDESNNYFPENEVYRFKVHLKVPLSFSGFWKVGLMELQVKKTSKSRPRGKSKSDNAIYIFTNFCKDSILKGVETPILRRLEMNTRDGWSYSFDTPIYVPMKRTELLEFEVYIKAEDGSFASFLESPLYLTLHFKQYPFYMDFESL